MSKNKRITRETTIHVYEGDSLVGRVIMNDNTLTFFEANGKRFVKQIQWPTLVRKMIREGRQELNLEDN